MEIHNAYHVVDDMPIPGAPSVQPAANQLRVGVEHPDRPSPADGLSRCKTTNSVA
jgi:hypothetical protein